MLSNIVGRNLLGFEHPFLEVTSSAFRRLCKHTFLITRAMVTAVLNTTYVQSSVVAENLICKWFGGPATGSYHSITSLNLDY
jgi:hypothetical protein